MKKKESKKNSIVCKDASAGRLRRGRGAGRRRNPRMFVHLLRLWVVLAFTRFERKRVKGCI